MAEFRPGNTDRVRDLCRKLKPIIGQKMDQLFSAYCAEDAAGKTQIETYLEALQGKYLETHLDDVATDLVPPRPEQSAGEYGLGTVQYAGKGVGEFGLREHEWIQHVGVFGRSGAGKTNIGLEIFRQLRQRGKPVLVFDWKRNYRDLLALPEFEDVEVYTIGRNVAPLRFNPLIPPKGSNPKTWLKQLIQVVAHAYCLGNGVLYLLQQTLDEVYEEFGVYTGNIHRWPTFRDILEKAKERDARGREAGWLSSTLRALSSLCFGEMDTMLNTSQNQSLERLLTNSVILEMDALTQSDKIFLVQSLLLWVHGRRIIDGEREVFKHAIMIEEAHHVLSNERHSLVGGQSVMEIVFREIREFGESIVFLDQHPSKISISALGNTFCTICFNLKHQKDIYAMAQSMLLASSEKDMLGSLEVGQAVVKLQGRTARPFLVNVPEFPIQKGVVSDAHISTRMAGIIEDAFPTHVYGSPPSCGSAATSTTMSSGVPAAIYQDGEEGLPDPRTRALLADVNDYPESGIAARYKRIGISVRQGQKLKAQLVNQELIEEREQRTQTGRIRIIRLTEKGRAAMLYDP